jgi:hypothetical protein
VRGARVVPHRVGGRRHATLRLSLSAPGRVRVTITRVSGPRRGAVATRRYSAPALKVSLRLPKRFHGHAYAPGRYRVTVVAVDAQGSRSHPVRRTFVVRG